MATFEIGTQNAGSIQNVAGDMTIHELGVQASWDAGVIRRELEQVRDEAARVPLPHADRVAVEGALAAAESEAARAEPDRGKIGRLVERATQVLADAGALAAAGSGLAESLRRTAVALGPAGKALLAVLPLL
jgi:hypothetical protein